MFLRFYSSIKYFIFIYKILLTSVKNIGCNFSEDVNYNLIIENNNATIKAYTSKMERYYEFSERFY